MARLIGVGDLFLTEIAILDLSMIDLVSGFIVVALILVLMDLELAVSSDPSSSLSAEVALTYLLFFLLSIGVGLGMISSDSLLSSPSSIFLPHSSFFSRPLPFRLCFFRSSLLFPPRSLPPPCFFLLLLFRQDECRLI